MIVGANRLTESGSVEYDLVFDDRKGKCQAANVIATGDNDSGSSNPFGEATEIASGGSSNPFGEATEIASSNPFGGCRSNGDIDHCTADLRLGLLGALDSAAAQDGPGPDFGLQVTPQPSKRKSSVWSCRRNGLFS